jgi:dipeptidyl aminopeptidase/acylaminoacyl peptidase
MSESGAPNGEIHNLDPVSWPEGSIRAFPYLAGVSAWRLTYGSDGLRVRGYLLRPQGDGPFPSVIYNRGGNREFASLTDATVERLLARIASWGYVVVASQYRGNCGGEGREEFGGSDINDVMNLLPLLDGLPYTDGLRMGMVGGSRGGMMTYLALTRTDRIRAAVIRCGVSDLRGWKSDRADMERVLAELIPGFDPEDDRCLASRSAVLWPERLCKTTPLLLLQGTADWRVSPHSALEMAHALLRAGHPFRLVMLEGSDHALSEHVDERDRLMREWLDRFVRDREDPPDVAPHGD